MLKNNAPCVCNHSKANHLNTLFGLNNDKSIDVFMVVVLCVVIVMDLNWII
jgi:hypothetical protein